MAPGPQSKRAMRRMTSGSPPGTTSRGARPHRTRRSPAATHLVTDWCLSSRRGLKGERDPARSVPDSPAPEKRATSTSPGPGRPQPIRGPHNHSLLFEHIPSSPRHGPIAHPLQSGSQPASGRPASPQAGGAVRTQRAAHPAHAPPPAKNWTLHIEMPRAIARKRPPWRMALLTAARLRGGFPSHQHG